MSSNNMFILRIDSKKRISIKKSLVERSKRSDISIFFHEDGNLTQFKNHLYFELKDNSNHQNILSVSKLVDGIMGIYEVFFDEEFNEERFNDFKTPKVSERETEIIIGKNYEILEGPFASLTMEVVKIEGEKVYGLINLFGTDTPLELSKSNLKTLLK